MAKRTDIVRALWLATLVLSVGLTNRLEARQVPVADTPDSEFYVSEFSPGAARSWRPESGWSMDELDRPMAILEVTRLSDQGSPTPAQQAAADALAERTLAAAARLVWF